MKNKGLLVGLIVIILILGTGLGISLLCNNVVKNAEKTALPAESVAKFENTKYELAVSDDLSVAKLEAISGDKTIANILDMVIPAISENNTFVKGDSDIPFISAFDSDLTSLFKLNGDSIIGAASLIDLYTTGAKYNVSQTGNILNMTAALGGKNYFKELNYAANYGSDIVASDVFTLPSIGDAAFVYDTAGLLRIFGLTSGEIDWLEIRQLGTVNPEKGTFHFGE